MTKEEELLSEYQKKQREIDEQEESIQIYQKRREQAIESTFSEIQHDLYGEEDSQEILHEAYRELQEIEDNYQETLEKERKKLNQQRDEIEINYKKNLQSLKDS